MNIDPLSSAYGEFYWTIVCFEKSGTIMKAMLESMGSEISNWKTIIISADKILTKDQRIVEWLKIS